MEIPDLPKYEVARGRRRNVPNNDDEDGRYD